MDNCKFSCLCPSRHLLTDLKSTKNNMKKNGRMARTITPTVSSMEKAELNESLEQ